MTWTMHAVTNPVTSGTRASWEIDIECSALADPEDCANPVLTLQPPANADDSVVATDPQAQSSFVTALDPTGDGGATVQLSAMTPGTSRSFLISWLVPNYTVLPGTELTPGGSLTYQTDGATVGPVDPIDSDDTTTVTEADPQVQVTKVLSASSTAAPGSTASYVITACIPSDTPGQLAFTHLHVVDTLTVSPAEDAGSEATFTDLDGGVLGTAARTVTWDIDIATDDPQPICGSGDEIVRTASITYPEGMQPAPGGDPRVVTNNADVSATTLGGGEAGGSSSVTHTFEPGSGSGSAPFVTVQLAADPASTVKGSLTSPFTWSDWLSLGGTAAYDNDIRGLAELESFACMSNRDSSNLPSTRDLSAYGPSGADAFTGIFAPDASYVPPSIGATQCDDPAFQLQTIDFRSLLPDDGDGHTIEQARFTVYYWDTATSSAGVTWLSIGPVAAQGTQSIDVYGTAIATSLGLASSQIVTDVLVATTPFKTVPEADRGWQWTPDLEQAAVQVDFTGVQTQVFADDPAMAMSNNFAGWVSDVASGYTFDDVAPDVTADGLHFAASAIYSPRTETFIDTFVAPTLTKTAVSDVSALRAGDVVTWEVVGGNSTRSSEAIRPVVYDLLPTGLEYVPGSAVWSGLPDGVTAPGDPTISTNAVTGETQLTWSFADQDFDPGETATVRFDTTVTTAASAGAHTATGAQAAFLKDAGDDISANAGAEPDTDDLDGDGSTTDLVMTAEADWTVLVESQAIVQKFVRGSAGDGTWKSEDVSTAALASSTTDATDGSDVDYRIQVSNPGTAALQNIVIYDILPSVGDTGVGADLADQARGSQFAVTFMELLGTLPDGVNVQYSTSSNPARPELGVTTGDGTWSDTLPDDPTTVRALRFVVAGPLAAGEQITIDWRGSLPDFRWDQAEELCQATVAEKAWNSVAYRADRVYGTDDVRSLLPAEAPSVSIREVCGQIGDYAWYDANRDGIQDADEEPASGVTFQLVAGDGTPVVDEEGDPVTAVTDAEGRYHFDVPVGDWRVEVVQIPDGTALTTANAGDDDALDSDVPALDAPSDAVTISAQSLDDETLDAGLVGVVSAGDLVWSDTNGDGIQDAGEPGIEGVELTLTGPGGQPVTDVNGDVVGPVTTDANGSYSFDGLPALADGQSYTVTVSRTPDGYLPTRADVGDDRAKDSSTGSASSEGLTEPGQRDATLDFGFVLAVPRLDIEKLDTAGNDADTEQDTVVISGSTRDLVLVVTNTGTEGLRDVTVSDETIRGAASVSVPVCTFPDGSSGLTYAGVLAPGESFRCTATVSGLVPGDRHTDVSTASGTGVVSGKYVSGTDPYNVVRTSGLAITGADASLGLVLLAALLALGGGVLLILRRRPRGKHLDQA
ncbi:MAG TPA: SdrD B-like domain-containing protein [Cellulomonas sp.]